MARLHRLINFILLNMISLLRQGSSTRVTRAFFSHPLSGQRRPSVPARTSTSSSFILHHPSSRGLASSSSSVEGDEEPSLQQTGTFGAKLPFNQLGLSTPLLDALEKAGKSISTHIQALSLPPIIDGDDVIIGSGTSSLDMYNT